MDIQRMKFGTGERQNEEFSLPVDIFALLGFS
jgi:hypothetical protein